MSEMDEKAVVKINADGEVVACAKGLAASECGYKAGSKVCGACGAMVVQGKGAMEPAEDEDPAYTEEVNETLAKRKKREEIQRSHNLGAKAGMGMKPTPDEEEEDDEEPGAIMEDEMEEASMWMKPKRRSRARAMMSMGVKAEELDDPDGAFLCQFDRKVMSGSSDVCSNCPGGCAAEDGMPGILDIEGMALDLFGGKVLSSGYADEADLFIVDVLGKDGRAVEILADGSTGEILNFHRLNAEDLGSAFGKKSADAEPSFKVIDIKSAETIALGVLASEIKTTGDVVQADSEIFEGYDSYVFEVNGMNGKSYDVYVGIDGTPLGYDEYDSDEAEEIEAEAAEIALKRAYNEESRSQMAESGMAMPDGSFPIKDRADLMNAIKAHGRAKDIEAAKKHIIKRAMDLGLEELIPTEWVPKDVQAAAAGKKSDDTFLASLMEFEILSAEEDFKDTF